MNEKNSTTIKGSAGYDSPWWVFGGTVAEQKKQIQQAFGLEKSNANTLAELAVEASLVAHALVNASTLGAKPTTTSGGSRKQSIADKKAEVANPEDATDKVEDLVANAVSPEALVDIYKAHQDNITPEQVKLFAAKKKELQSK
jgi:hypothetical protein